MAKRMRLSCRAGGPREDTMRLARSRAAGMALAGLIVAGLGGCGGGDDDEVVEQDHRSHQRGRR